jgi:hypothetical protein
MDDEESVTKNWAEYLARLFDDARLKGRHMRSHQLRDTFAVDLLARTWTRPSRNPFGRPLPFIGGTLTVPFPLDFLNTAKSSADTFVLYIESSTSGCRR